MAAAMVEALGRGGQARVAVAAEMSRNTLIVGSVELSSGRVRRFGSAGRVRVVSVLLILVRTCWWCWTHSWSRSRGVIRCRRCGGRRSRRGCCRRELHRLGHRAGESLVGRMLHYVGYSLQANAKVAGAQNPNRNAQFEYINARAGEHLAGGEPVISIDCKRKELVGRVIETSRYSPPRILTIVPKESPVAGATKACGLPEPSASAFRRSMCTLRDNERDLQRRCTRCPSLRR